MPSEPPEDLASHFGPPTRNKRIHDWPGRSEASGSRGGSIVWTTLEVFEGEDPRPAGRGDHLWAHDMRNRNAVLPDPDGFAVFGVYPKGFITWVMRRRLLGADVARDEILHVCSGTLSRRERWTVDIRPQARPRLVADGRLLPFRARAFKAVMLDPPYSELYSRALYHTDNPRPSWLLTEAARVVRPGGRIGMMHFAVPMVPPGCHYVRTVAVMVGMGYRIRAFSVYERDGDQAEIF